MIPSLPSVPVDFIRTVEGIHASSKPAGEVCGIPLRVCDPRAFPPGVAGVIIDPMNPAGAVFLVQSPPVA